MGLCVTHNLDCNLVVAKNRGNYLCIHTDKKMRHTRQILATQRTIKPYNDLMWCVTVKNHTLFTELNGKPMLSGNSRNKNKSVIESMVINYGGFRIYMTHNPKFAKPDFKWNFAGHVHEKWQFQKLGENSTIVNLSVEQWKYAPVTIGEIQAAYSRWIKSGMK
jgi:calcineurin-like phosphoesterase family protein